MATTQKVSPETILESLAAHPRLTAAELAEVLGIGQSTAAKHLATLEVAGTARREPGGRDGGRRMADRWSAMAPAADDAAHDGADHAAPDGPVRSTDRLARGELGALVRAYWPPGRARTSDPPRSARHSAVPKERCPTPSPDWRSLAMRSS